VVCNTPSSVTPQPFEAPAPYLVFRRWDQVPAAETPQLAIFFATPDVLAGLFTLANYDGRDPHGVIAPMGSGCASIISYPYAEGQSAQPRCVLGMFDVSARPCVPRDVLAFTVPLHRLARMTSNMDESFLVTKSWETVRERL